MLIFNYRASRNDILHYFSFRVSRMKLVLFARGWRLRFEERRFTLQQDYNHERSITMLKNIFRIARPASSSLRASSSLIGRQSYTRFVTPIRFYSNESIDKKEITTRVIDVIKAFDKTTASSSVNDQTLFHKDLGLDSLDTVELLVAIEEEFDIEIPDKVADELKSVGETVNYIASNPEAH